MKKFKRIQALFLAIVLVVSSMSMSAFAAEVEDTNADSATTNSSFVPLSETEYSRDDAIRIMGMTEEEAEGVEFFLVDAEPISSDESSQSARGVVINPGQTHNFPSFSFTSKNVGSYWTCKGTQLRWTAVHNTCTPYDINHYVTIFLYAYGDEDPNDVMACHSYMDFLMVGETRSYGFMSAVKGLDYHFVYYCPGGGQYRSTVTMMVAVK